MNYPGVKLLLTTDHGQSLSHILFLKDGMIHCFRCGEGSKQEFGSVGLGGDSAQFDDLVSEILKEGYTSRYGFRSPSAGIEFLNDLKFYFNGVMFRATDVLHVTATEVGLG